VPKSLPKDLSTPRRSITRVNNTRALLSNTPSILHIISPFNQDPHHDSPPTVILNASSSNLPPVFLHSHATDWQSQHIDSQTEMHPALTDLSQTPCIMATMMGVSTAFDPHGLESRSSCLFIGR